MKKITFLSMIWLALTSLHSQAGLKMGVNLADMTEQNLYAKSNFLPRFQTGFSFRPAKLGKNTRLAIEMLMTWKGQHYTYEQSFDVITEKRTIKTDIKDKLTYFEMPFLISTAVSEKLNIQMGPIFGLRLSGKKTGKTTVTVLYKSSNTSSAQDFDEKAKYSDTDAFPSGSSGIFNRPLKIYEISLAVGANYKFSKKLAIYGRYTYGLTDIFSNNYPFKNASNTTEVNKGIQIGLLLLFKE